MSTMYACMHDQYTHTKQEARSVNITTIHARASENYAVQIQLMFVQLLDNLYL